MNRIQPRLVVKTRDEKIFSYDVMDFGISVSDRPTSCKDGLMRDIVVDGRVDDSVYTLLARDSRSVFGDYLAGLELIVNAESGNSLPKIKRVLYNYPATIVFWEDGSKTVAKVQDDDLYDKKKGVVICMLKKMMGNDNSYNKLMNALEKEAAKWVSSDE